MSTRSYRTQGVVLMMGAALATAVVVAPTANLPKNAVSSRTCKSGGGSVTGPRTGPLRCSGGKYDGRPVVDSSGA